MRKKTKNSIKTVFIRSRKKKKEKRRKSNEWTNERTSDWLSCELCRHVLQSWHHRLSTIIFRYEHQIHVYLWKENDRTWIKGGTTTIKRSNMFIDVALNSKIHDERLCSFYNMTIGFFLLLSSFCLHTQVIIIINDNNNNNNLVW